MDTQVMACSGNWLDYTPTTTSGSAINTTITTASVFGYGYYTYASPYYWVTPSDARPIKLKMSEVEILRKAAKDDPKLKAILNKFTNQIEIAVDFD
jgi:hypothetical protein